MNLETRMALIVKEKLRIISESQGEGINLFSDGAPSYELTIDPSRMPSNFQQCIGRTKRKHKANKVLWHRDRLPRKLKKKLRKEGGYTFRMKKTVREFTKKYREASKTELPCGPDCPKCNGETRWSGSGHGGTIYTCNKCNHEFWGI